MKSAILALVAAGALLVSTSNADARPPRYSGGYHGAYNGYRSYNAGYRGYRNYNGARYYPSYNTSPYYRSYYGGYSPAYYPYGGGFSLNFGQFGLGVGNGYSYPYYGW